MPSPHRLGWIPDVGDKRDHVYSLPAIKTLPKSIDLRAGCPPVYDQGSLGSCTANALVAAYELLEAQPVLPSRLFVYFNERVREHTISSDSGASLRDGIKSLAQQGDCPESMWPYDIGRFTASPSPECYAEAKKHRITSYMRVPRSLGAMCGCLASGFSFVFGCSVYESFESPEVATTGIVPIPAMGENLLGGHAVLAVGYDDARHVFLCRNSWGPSWGDKGYFTIPYAYLLSSDLADDFWTLRKSA